MQPGELLEGAEIALKRPTAPSLSRFQDLLERQIHELHLGRL